MTAFQSRQGDILFMALDGVPSLEGATPRTDKVLALGEATGHSHRLECTDSGCLEMHDMPSGDILVRGSGSIQVLHEEHAPIPLPSDRWVLVRRQREYDPVAMARQRLVLD